MPLVSRPLERILSSSPPAELVAKACTGDAAAFGAIARIVDSDLRGVVWAVLRDQHSVDDVMQMAYEKAFRQIAGFEQRSNLKTWLHSICYRTAIDYLRHEGRRRHEDVDATPLESAHSISDAVATKLEFAAVMDQMDPETRTLLMLTAGFGHSYDEVSEITGIARGTVASRVARAKERIRNATI